MWFMLVGGYIEELYKYNEFVSLIDYFGFIFEFFFVVIVMIGKYLKIYGEVIICLNFLMCSIVSSEFF